VLLTQIPVGALNDIVDREQDARAQPDKPIPRGLISTRHAGLLTAISLAALVAVLASFGPSAFALVIPATLGGIAYDLWLKPTPAAVLGYAAGFLLLFTWLWLVAGHLGPPLFALWPAGMLLLLAAHLTQSLPDIETDQALGHRGLACRLGLRGAVRTVGVAYGVVCCTAIGLAVISRQPLAGTLAAGGLVVGLAGWLTARTGLQTRVARLRFFHVVAPGVGLIALSLLLSIK